MPDATALSNALRNDRVVQRPVLTVHAGLKGDPRQNRLLAALPVAGWQVYAVRTVGHLQLSNSEGGNYPVIPSSASLLTICSASR